MAKIKKFDTAVYIGRFQPFHNGHLHTLIQALELADEVVILLGSANRAPNIRNPWTVTQRETMIRSVMQSNNIPQSRVTIMPIKDYPYNDELWLAEVQAKVNAHVNTKSVDDPKVALVGFERDHTSFYLDLFPQWSKIEIEEIGKINATEIRNILFETTGYFNTHILGDAIRADVPKATLDWIENFFATDRKAAERFRSEFHHVKKYKKAWETAPYEPTFVTVDAVVIQAGHILLVQRGASPGEGLWALPGGFLNINERVTDGIIRELIEETQIKVPEKVLRGSIKARDYFDDPDRSLRGRTITFAHYFALEAVPDGLPKIKGSDDAVKAKWFPLAEFKQMENVMFEDHSFIVNTLVGNL